MRSEHATGVVLVVISAVAFSTAGLFIKAAEASVWAIIFWRAVSATVVTIIYLNWKGKLRNELMAMSRPAWTAGVVGAVSSVAFIPAYKYTSIANVSLIYAASPFIAAMMIWIWIRERPPGKVLVASAAAFMGVFVIVGGSFGGGQLTGDLMALWMTIGMSLYLCFYRRYPGLPTAGPAILSQLLLIPVCLWMWNPMDITIQALIITVLFGVVFVLAAITLAEGASRLPVAETTLLGILETPLAPIWAYLLFVEIPGYSTMLGGVVIMLAVLASQWPIDRLSHHRSRKPTAKSVSEDI